jgi:hypothetical protein
MIGFIIGELAATGVLSLIFLIMFLTRRTGPNNPDPGVRAASRNIIAVSLVWASESFSFAALGVGAPVPLWMFAVLFGGGIAVIIHRIILIVRAGHHQREGDADHE